MNFDKYKSTIGIERLKSFGFGSDILSEDFLLRMYEINIKVSQSLYPALSIIEVHLRNAIDVMIQATVSKNWLENEITEQKLLLDYDYQKLLTAYKTLNIKYGKENITHGKLISELTFGFWVNLCSKKYSWRIWNKKYAFRMVFQGFPQKEKENISVISQKLVKIKNLRNRIFHYEPILGKKDKFGDIYNTICEIIAYLPDDNSKIFERTNNFPKEVYGILKEVKL